MMVIGNFWRASSFQMAATSNELSELALHQSQQGALVFRRHPHRDAGREVLQCAEGVTESRSPDLFKRIRARLLAGIDAWLDGAG